MQDDARTAEGARSARPAGLATSETHTLRGGGSSFLNGLTAGILAAAARKCARGVRWKSSVAVWMFNLWLNCAVLRSRILAGEYRLSRYVVFMVYDKKPRKIHSTKFTDRVVQRAMCDNGLLDDIRRPLVYENGACLEGKGFSFAFNLVERHLRRFYFENGRRSNKGWYVKIDVRKFFDSTPHSVLKGAVKKTVRDPWMRVRVAEIIDSFKDPRPPAEIESDPFGSRGVILGSQISQLLQLLVLNGLDHAIKQRCGIKYYVRYMDDMLMLVKTKEEAVAALKTAENELEKLGLRLNEKSRIGRIQDGLSFLNVRFRLTGTGKIKKKLGKKTIARERKRLKTLARKLKNGQLRPADLVQHANSWFGSNARKMSKGQLKMLKRAVRDNLAGAAGK